MGARLWDAVSGQRRSCGDLLAGPPLALCSWFWFVVRPFFVQGVGIDFVGGADTRHVACLPHPCPCQQVRARPFSFVSLCV